MTITVPNLGPSWLPKFGGILAVISAAFEAVPNTAPGMEYIHPWIPFLNAVAIGLIGFSARQNNVPSESVGVAPGQPKGPELPAPSGKTP